MSDLPAAVVWISWAVSGLGLGLLAASLILRPDPIRRQRMQDCAVALIFGGVLARVIVQDERDALDWVLAVVSPIFIAAAVWRLSHTQAHAGSKPE